MKLDLKHHEKKQCWDYDSSPCPYPLPFHVFPQGHCLKMQRYNDPSCPRYGLITEEEAKAAERYDALMEHSEAIANAPKKQTEAYVVADVCQNHRNLQHSLNSIKQILYRAVFSNHPHPFLFLEAYKKLLAIPGSPAARGLGKTPSLYQRTAGGSKRFLLSCQKRGVLILCQVMDGTRLFSNSMI